MCPHRSKELDDAFGSVQPVAVESERYIVSCRPVRACEYLGRFVKFFQSRHLPTVVPGSMHSDPQTPDYGIRTPEMARAITRRWISEVPSKIV